MKVKVSQREINLSKTDFVASGGEASIYAQNGTAFKIYTDPKRSIPSSKISELKSISDPCVIKPEEIVYDISGDPIGYTMRHLSGTESLCRIFTKSFRDRSAITNDQITKLVQKMQNSMAHCHSKNVLIVDCNEMNFLVSGKFDEVYFIDVDSYQTLSHPATALMESVRDRHMTMGKNGRWMFNHQTDWFSWAIVTFQLFIGIHPYKGTHPTVKGLDDRMKLNKSVFNKEVSIPKICYSLDVIPQSYRDWYKAIFEDGKRVNPPSSLIQTVTIVTAPKIIIGSNKFIITEIEKLEGNIIYYGKMNGWRVALTSDFFYIGRNKYKNVPSYAEIGVTKKGTIYAVYVDRHSLKIFDIVKQTLSTDSIQAESVMSCDGRVYYKNQDTIFELSTIETNSLTAVGKPVANVIPSSTKMYSGTAIQNILGSCFVSIFPQTGMHYQIRVKELENKKIIDAKYEKRILMVSYADRNGKYGKATLKLNKDFDKYEIDIEDDIDYAVVNFAVLDNGVCASIDSEERMVLFSNKEKSTQKTIVEDPAISHDMKLLSSGDSITFTSNEKAFSIKMK